MPGHAADGHAQIDAAHLRRHFADGSSTAIGHVRFDTRLPATDPA
jgi:hypothetical protein